MDLPLATRLIDGLTPVITRIIDNFDWLLDSSSVVLNVSNIFFLRLTSSRPNIVSGSEYLVLAIGK